MKGTERTKYSGHGETCVYSVAVEQVPQSRHCIMLIPLGNSAPNVFVVTVSLSTFSREIFDLNAGRSSGHCDKLCDFLLFSGIIWR
jgi:hypothetical protein